MQLKVLSYPDVEQARIWRNDNLSMNRTPYLLTSEMQGEFFQEQVCNRQANARYWGIWEEEKTTIKMLRPMKDVIVNFPLFIGMGEISMQWENRLGEIGLIMHPEHLDKAEESVDLILEQGFNNLNLENIFGECYYCSSYMNIWERACKKYKGTDAQLPNRKFWQGEYCASLYFNINREEWKKCK